jgi:hypothetical protein
MRVSATGVSLGRRGLDCRLTCIKISSQNIPPISRELRRHLDGPKINVLFGIGAVFSRRLQHLKSLSNGDIESIAQRHILKYGEIACWRHHALCFDDVGREKSLQDAGRSVAPSPSRRTAVAFGLVVFLRGGRSQWGLGRAVAWKGPSKVLHVVEAHDGDVGPHSAEASRENQVPDAPYQRRRHGELHKGLDPRVLGYILSPGVLLQLGLGDACRKVVRHNDVAEDVESTLLHRVAELNEACLAPGIVDEEDDLRSPELDVLGFQAQEIFPHLVID